MSRPEYILEVENAEGKISLVRPLSIWERLYQTAALRKFVLLLLLILTWQVYANWMNNPLMLPTFGSIVEAFFDALLKGTLAKQTLYSVRLLVTGYAIGVGISFALTVLAMTTKIGTDFLETLTAMFSPLPAIAILPIAMLWFGLGETSLVFVLVNSIVWPIALNVHSGFKGVSNTLRMVGKNYDLKGLPFVLKILVPAAFPSILTGLKVGWAFGWRTLIASELVFGVSSGSGGLGWFIYENKNQLEIASVFAGLLMVINIGLIVENLIFQTIEKHTIEKWGMQN